MDYTHYIIVRRDLPFGVTCAMVAHAAGESFYELRRGSSVEVEHHAFSVGVAGSIPAPGSNWSVAQGVERQAGNSCPGEGGSQPSRPANFTEKIAVIKPTVVILGARNERKLDRLRIRLLDAAVGHVSIYEPDPPYNGQLMAIGLVPGHRDKLYHHVKDYHMLPEPGF